MAALNSTITTRQAREDRAIYRAMGLLEKRLRKPGEMLNASSTVHQYLALNLAEYDREVFSALWLDTQHRLIAAEHLFVGTLTQASVYPREVARRCLQMNAAAVIFAHNHPSGAAEPSHADLILTRALMDTLALLDVRVLDHFIVAGRNAFSFEEGAVLSRYEEQRQAHEAEKRKARKPRAKVKAASARPPAYGAAMTAHV